MFLSLLTFPLPRFLQTASMSWRNRSLSVYLPILAIEWFNEMDRMTGGLVAPKFNTEDAIQSILAGEQTEESQKAVIMNSKWNIVWSKYCLAVLEPGLYPMIEYSFNNVVRYNTRFLKELGETEPSISIKLIEHTKSMGFDLIAGDLVANSYVDAIWGEMVEGLEHLTAFRDNYVQATKSPENYIPDENTGLIARAIALSEIAWSNSFFPFRDVSDMMMFELIWNIRFSTGMMSNFIRAANLVGAGMSELSSREIIRLVGSNPDSPIEEVIG